MFDRALPLRTLNYSFSFFESNSLLAQLGGRLQFPYTRPHRLSFFAKPCNLSTYNLSNRSATRERRQQIYARLVCGVLDGIKIIPEKLMAFPVIFFSLSYVFTLLHIPFDQRTERECVLFVASHKI